MSLQRTWDVLAQREHVRMALSAAVRPTTKEELFYAITISKQNRRGNRYSNVYAYDRTAVTVDGEYLNANVIKHGAWWIAAQAPLPHTFELFFKAIQTRAASRHPLINKETNGAIIVQLTNDIEHGAVKADPYLSLHTIEKQEKRKDISATVSEFRLGDVPVTHYLFGGWPDFGVPEGAEQAALRNLILEVQEKGRDKEIWVHCSAGVGRSGTFIALSSLLSSSPRTESPLGPLPKDLADDRVAHTVDAIRDYRGALIQSKGQLGLVYDLR